MSRLFHLVDVFGAEPFKGNPLAVIFAADDLSVDRMQDITRWLNLSETTFLLPPTEPGADYRVRIFTVASELPFAGHPTLGTCHAWLASGGMPMGADIIQQCEAGLVSIRRTGNGLAFAAPPLVRSGPATDAEIAEAASILGIDPGAIVDGQWIDNGPGWLGLLLDSAEAVLAARPKRASPERIHLGIAGPHPAGAATDWEVRAIISDQHGGLIEDPVTGSLNASMAQWLIGSGRAQEKYVASQGAAIGRTGRVFIEQDDAGAIWVAGATRTLFSGPAGF